jgi:hypothetical protein
MVKFLQKLATGLSKKRLFFAKRFGKNIFKITTSVSVCLQFTKLKGWQFYLGGL